MLIKHALPDAVGDPLHPLRPSPPLLAAPPPPTATERNLRFIDRSIIDGRGGVPVKVRPDWLGFVESCRRAMQSGQVRSQIRHAICCKQEAQGRPFQ